MTTNMPLFASLPRSRELLVPKEAQEVAKCVGELERVSQDFLPGIDERMLDVFARADNPADPFELRDLWLGRIEYELGPHGHRPWLTRRWRNSRRQRHVTAEEVLASRATVRLVKELFNWFFSHDLYGDLRSDHHIILSSGSVDEQAWGLPQTLKACIRYALDRDWYGYSDSRGRIPVREAIAAYESARITNVTYTSENVALTMGGTFAISALIDFLLLGAPTTGAPVLCGIPNYPPLVEAAARRRNIQLVPLPSQAGYTSLEPLIARLTPQTPLVLLQTVANPTGATILEAELARLIQTASPSTIILLDECHEWLGPFERYAHARAASNVIRVFSISKTWSAPGLKIGWILADARVINEYYEYASTTYGGPPSFFYTMIESMARMERWHLEGVEQIGGAELKEFEASYQLNLSLLQEAYTSYCRERRTRDIALKTMRDATSVGLTRASAALISPRYSINTATVFPDWDDSYKCFRDLLRETGIAVFPGILTFCLSGGLVRITTARNWQDLSCALTRLEARFTKHPGPESQTISASLPKA